MVRKFFDHEYFYTTYVDNTTFFLEDISSIKVVLKDLNLLSGFSGLHPNFIKSGIAGIGVLESVNVALCGMKSLDVNKECIKVSGVHISYNKKLQDNNNFCDTVKNVFNIIRLWRMRQLSLEGKAIIFKSLAVSKIVYLALLTLIPNPVLEELKQMQETFLWEEISGQKYSMIHYVKTLLKMVLEVWTKNINFDIKMFLDTIAI